jgi:hypothetical protein
MAVERCDLPDFDLRRIAPGCAGTGNHRCLDLGEIFHGDPEIAVRHFARRREGLRPGPGDEDRAPALRPRQMRLGSLPRRGPTGEKLADECGARGKLGNRRSCEADIARAAMPGTKAEHRAVWHQKIE